MTETITPVEIVAPTYARDTKTGRFLAGTGGAGRKPGSRNKLGEAFLADLAEAWAEHGPEALARCAKEEPAQFIRTVASLMPRESISFHVGAIDAGNFALKFREALAALGNDPDDNADHD